MVNKIFSFAELGFQKFESFEISHRNTEAKRIYYWDGRFPESNRDGLRLGKMVRTLIAFSVGCRLYPKKASQYPDWPITKPIVEGAPGSWRRSNGRYILLNYHCCFSPWRIDERGKYFGGTWFFGLDCRGVVVASKWRCGTQEWYWIYCDERESLLTVLTPRGR